MTPNAPFGRRSRSSGHLQNSTPGMRPGARRSSRHASGSSPAGFCRGGDPGKVFGDAPECRCAMEAAAEPGTVLVTSTVANREVAGLFIVEDKGAHELKGACANESLSHPADKRRRRGPKRRPASHLFRRPRRRPRNLARCSERAFAGAGQFVLIVGEPGIGNPGWLKSFAGSWPRKAFIRSNGIRRSCCRTRHCTLSSRGDATNSAVLRSRPSGGWPSSDRSSPPSSSIRDPRSPACAAWSTSSSRLSAHEAFRRRGIRRRLEVAAIVEWAIMAPVTSRSFLSLRTCSGSTRRRSI